MQRSPHYQVLCLLMLCGVLATRAFCADPAGTNRPAALPDPSEEAVPTPSDDPPPAASRSGDAQPDPQTGDAPAADPTEVPGPAGTAPPSLPNTENIPLPPQEDLPLGPIPSGNEGGAPAADARSGSWVLQTLTGLGVVIGLILLLRMALLRMGATPAARGPAGLVEVLARTTIAPRTHLLFLRINQRVIVASQTSTGLRPLTELTHPDDVAWLLGNIEANKPTSISRGFQQLMHKFDRDYSDTSQAPSTGKEEAPDASADWRIDRTRNELSGLLSHIRNLKHRDEDTPTP